MTAKDVKLIGYSKKVDFFNCITHAAGAVGGVAALVLMVLKAHTQGARHTASAVIYGLSIIAVFSVSAVYHGLKNGEAKRIARLVDHSTVPVLIAGTATPCALITLYEISTPHCILVMTLAWFCSLFGMVSKIFFFEKLRKVTPAVYIVSCLIMLCSAVPLLDKMDLHAFLGLGDGCVFYLIGAVFCALGIKKPAFHVIFHIFVVFAAFIHFFVIYHFVF